MSKFNSTSIKKALDNIVHNKYLLPAIQRKFVWSTWQIENLFDSIMRGYPINTMMLWNIKDKSVKEAFKFYKFINNYAQKFHEDNEDFPPNLFETEFDAVIDGQQRLTSLYIGLAGTYRAKKPNKRWKDNEDSLPTMRLYLCLSGYMAEDVENGRKYNFIFMTDAEKENDEKKYPEHIWFKVGDILNFNGLSDVNNYAKEHGFDNDAFALELLTKLYEKTIDENFLSYYSITNQNIDQVLDIFIRTNSGGTTLSFSDLLMSISSANWKNVDIRDEVEKLKKDIFNFGNPNFDVTQDFILKALLVLSDVDISFKLENFTKANVSTFETKWDDVKKSLKAAFELIESLNFNNTVLRAKNAVLPIAYYININNLTEEIVKSTYDMEDKQAISKWLALSLLKGIFGGQSDNVLKSIREVIKSNKGKKFPADAIIAKFASEPDKNYDFNDDFIDGLIYEQYGSPMSGAILNLLYPTVALEHGKAVAQDHMHPKVLFDKTNMKKLKMNDEDKMFYTDHFNTILNLQLLEEIKNKSKGETQLVDWVKNNNIKKDTLYVNDDTKLEFEYFKDFINDRKTNIVEKLKELLI